MFFMMLCNDMKISVRLAVILLLLTLKLGWSFQPCPENERKALLDFKKGVIGPSHRLSSWEGEDCCKWHGVRCSNKTGHVVKLNLRNPFPFGIEQYFSEQSEQLESEYKEALLTVVEVNPSLVELQYLSYLDLSWNNFSRMSIPNVFGSFSKLRYLNLSSALFGGVVPHHLGNLSSLVSVDLSDNDYLYRDVKLSVDSFHWISRLSLLQHLDMSRLNLSNIHGDSFGATASFPSNLLRLRLSDCELSVFPLFHSLRNLTSLLVLDLSGNNFDNRIQDAMWNMTALEVLQLSSNYNMLDCGDNIFNGFRNLVNLDMSECSCRSLLPNSFFRLKNLKQLDLSYNSFHGPIPTSLGNLTLLEELSLGENKLSGEIPTSIGGLSSLKHLDLVDNELSGEIPNSLGGLPLLKYLYLSDNGLSGEIPMSFWRLSNLEDLYLYANSLKGLLSEMHFAKLSKLKFLQLSGNSFTLNTKPDWIPPFQLNTVYLSDCKVGPHFPPWIQTQRNITSLFLRNSSIEGSIPFWFKNSLLPTLVGLDLSHNQIHEMDFQIRSLSLLSLKLSNNKISGSLPENIGHMLPNLYSLSLQNNHFNGSIPKSLCNITSLRYIIISNNTFSGYLPNCWSDAPSVEIIDFSSNNLSGNIPTSIGKLPNLRSLHLNKNNFYGEIPSSLRNCKYLTILDLGENNLSGKVPTWIGEELSSLQTLRLRSNNFGGSLSPRLCNLSHLQILDVGQNDLSGSIPRCFGNIPSMVSFRGEEFSNNSGYDEPLNQVLKGTELEYSIKLQFMVVNLDLSDNGFVGHIPEELTNLSALIGLNLSNNHLTGPIPTNIGQMTSLESLDFSMNQLTGMIPQSISSLSSLSHLNLSYNNLSGQIPSGNQLQVLSDPTTIYLGNIKLCGPPLSKVCNADEPSPAPEDANSKDDDEEEFNKSFFYIGMSCGVAVGFWGFCGVLLLKKTWRAAYFRFINDIVTRVYDRVYVAIDVRINRNKFCVE